MNKINEDSLSLSIYILYIYVALYVPRTFNQRMVQSCFLTFYVVGRDLAITDRAAALNLTRYNRINSLEIIGSNPTRKKMISLNPLMITKHDQLSFNYCIYLFHKFYVAAYFASYFDNLLASIVSCFGLMGDLYFLHTT